jgi:protein-S-isoprenylcysteine O-methyltransferase Ste14
MYRAGIFIYAIVCYVVFLLVFLYGIGFIGGFVTPTSLDALPTRPLLVALAIDFALLAVFALQHSGMARPAFKDWWTRFVPVAAERSTYVLLSSLALAALYGVWEPIGGEIWKVTAGGWYNVIVGIYLFGWALLLYTTFLIDHFDLFGLKQGWRFLTGSPYRAPQFHTPSLYKLVRHPLYIGWLIIFWAAPVMTVAHLIFALGTTAYILIAIRLEEHDLEAAFGHDYAEYRRRTPMLLPRIGIRQTSIPKREART